MLIIYIRIYIHIYLQKHNLIKYCIVIVNIIRCANVSILEFKINEITENKEIEMVFFFFK